MVIKIMVSNKMVIWNSRGEKEWLLAMVGMRLDTVRMRIVTPVTAARKESALSSVV